MIPTGFPRYTGQNLQLNTRLEMKEWLQLVSYHAESGSEESKEALCELVRNIPPYAKRDPQLQDVVAALKQFAQNKRFNPQLSPTTKQAIRTLAEEVDARPKPACARRLDFDDPKIYEGFDFS